MQILFTEIKQTPLFGWIFALIVISILTISIALS